MDTSAVDVIRSTAHSLTSVRILRSGILRSRRCRSLCSIAALCGFCWQLCTPCNLFEIYFIKIGTVEMARLGSILVAVKLSFSPRSSSIIVSDVGPSLYRIIIATCNEDNEWGFYFLLFGWKLKRKPRPNNILKPSNSLEYIQRKGSLVRLVWVFR